VTPFTAIPHVLCYPICTYESGRPTITTLNQELYEALIAAGAPDDIAKRAAASVLSRDDLSQLATKLDIAEVKRDLAELRAEMWKIAGAQTLLLIGVMVALKLFA
jgi:hypothetical protein